MSQSQSERRRAQLRSNTVQAAIFGFMAGLVVGAGGMLFLLKRGAKTEAAREQVTEPPVYKEPAEPSPPTVEPPAINEPRPASPVIEAPEPPNPPEPAAVADKPAMVPDPLPAEPESAAEPETDPEFEAQTEELALSIYKRWSELSTPRSASDEMALMSKARAAARKSYAYMIRSAKIGTELGASNDQREAVYLRGAPTAEAGGEVTDAEIRAWYAEAMAPKPKLVRWFDTTEDLPLEGPIFDAMLSEFESGAYKRMMQRIGFEPQDKSMVVNYAKKAGPRLARFYARAWNYGRTQGADHRLIQKLTLSDPNGLTRTIETMDVEFNDQIIRDFVDQAIKRARFAKKYGE